jgi:urease accessory protein
VGGRSVVTRALARSPLRLLTPRGPVQSAWLFTSTFGGGLLSGDRIELELVVESGAGCLLSTQSQTKVYRSAAGESAGQRLGAELQSDAMLVSLPDALTCFAGSAFEQRQRFEMDASASLLSLEWLTSGRRARGERWAMRSVRTRTDVIVDGKVVFRDALRLDESDGPIAGEHRMGRCDCFATVLLLGPKLAMEARRLLDWTSAQPASSEGVLFSGSPLRDGLVLRAAGPTTESVAGWLRQRLEFLPALLGANPWDRKW